MHDDVIYLLRCVIIIIPSHFTPECRRRRKREVDVAVAEKDWKTERENEFMRRLRCMMRYIIERCSSRMMMGGRATLVGMGLEIIFRELSVLLHFLSSSCLLIAQMMNGTKIVVIAPSAATHL